MNRSIEIAVMVVGGLCLFVVAFLGFVVLSGAPLSEVAVVGELFEPHETAKEAEGASEHELSAPPYSEEQVVEANLGLLDVYAFEPPYSAEELHSLALDLKEAKLSYEERLRAVAEREAAALDREELLRSQFETLQELRAELDRYEASLSLRSAELAPGTDAAAKRSPEEWAGIASVFTDTDAAAMKERLLQFKPDDAARILASLDPEQAASLLNALPTERWKEYVDAYSRVTRAQ